MDKIAIISDIHGNLEALIAVLKDIKERKIERIICLGDIIAKGANQKECVELIKKHCDVVLKGNCEDFFTKDIDLSTQDKITSERIKWNRSKLSEDDINYLSNLPFCYEFYLSGRLVRLLHSTPESLYDESGNLNSLDGFYKLLLPSDNTISNKKADIVICGHTHTPYVQKIYNRTIINSGSVGDSLDIFRNDEKDGNIFNTTVANYLILSGNYSSKNINEKISYELISIPYDIDKELETNQNNIELDAYKEELKNGKYRDMDKLHKVFEKNGLDINKI